MIIYPDERVIFGDTDTLWMEDNGPIPYEDLDPEQRRAKEVRQRAAASKAPAMLPSKL